MTQVGDERAAVMGMHPGSGGVYTLAALETQIPPGTKKVPKLYGAACHPTMPHIMAVAANSGVPLILIINTQAILVIHGRQQLMSRQCLRREEQETQLHLQEYITACMYQQIVSNSC